MQNPWNGCVRSLSVLFNQLAYSRAFPQCLVDNLNKYCSINHHNYSKTSKFVVYNLERKM